MNKRGFISAISKKASVSEAIASKVVDIYEQNLISGKSDEQIAKEICNGCELTIDDAKRIVRICRDVMKNELVRRIKHPFGR